MTDDHSLTHHGVDDSNRRRFPNDTLRLLIERSSCRSFADTAVPDDVLSLILDAGLHAASGGNLQPFSIIVIRNRDAKTRLAVLNEDQMFIQSAPVNLMFCIDWHRTLRWAEIENAPCSAHNSFRHFWISFQDTIIAAQNICTAADALGLGSVYVGTVLESFRETRELLKLPDGVFPIVLLSLGYPKFRPAPKRKLTSRAVVHDEKYRDPSDEELREYFDDKYPGWKMEITEDRLVQIAKVAAAVHGEAFAQRCIAAIRKQGFISAAQNYFGLHYQADLMPQGNDEYLKIMREFGFGWFERFVPAD